MKNKLIILSASIIFALTASITQAAIIKVEFAAQIESIMDDADILGGTVSVGDQINGWYAYDSNIAPSYSYDTYAHYEFNFAPCGIFLTIGNFEFKTDSSVTDFYIGIENDAPLGDSLTMVSSNNITVLEMPINTIGWQLEDDYSGIPIASLDLPSDAIDITDWPYNTLSIDGLKMDTNGYKEVLNIRATVTSAILVPEPLTVAFMLIGGMLVQSRKRR